MLDNARGLWERHVEENRQAVVRPQDLLPCHCLLTARITAIPRAQVLAWQDEHAEYVRSMATLSALMAGFVNVAFVQFDFTPTQISMPVLMGFAITNSLTVLLVLAKLSNHPTCSQATESQIHADGGEHLLHVHVHTDSGRHLPQVHRHVLRRGGSCVHHALSRLCPGVMPDAHPLPSSFKRSQWTSPAQTSEQPELSADISLATDLLRLCAISATTGTSSGGLSGRGPSTCSQRVRLRFIPPCACRSGNSNPCSVKCRLL